jgi:hypothetical protein
MPQVADQRRAALAKANAVRERQAALKRKLKAGTLPLAEALEHPELQHWPIADVVGFAAIGAQRWKGGAIKRAPQQALDLLTAATVGYHKTVGELTAYEMALLVGHATDLEQRRIRRRYAAFGRRSKGAGPYFLH